MQAQLLMIVHHKNLVSLIGYCKDDDNMALVYEFMSNGNLRQHLSGMDGIIYIKICMFKVDLCLIYHFTYLNSCMPTFTLKPLMKEIILIRFACRDKQSYFNLETKTSNCD